MGRVDNSEWRKWQKESWPNGSLERTLIRDFPGAKSLLDALEKAKKQRLGVTAAQSPQPPLKPDEPSELEKYRALQESIKTIAHYSHFGFDTWTVPDHVRARLNAMPLNSIEETILWRDCWKAEIKKIKEQSGDSKSGDDSSR